VSPVDSLFVVIFHEAIDLLLQFAQKVVFLHEDYALYALYALILTLDPTLRLRMKGRAHGVFDFPVTQPLRKISRFLRSEERRVGKEGRSRWGAEP